jgi:hypothetical protein
MSESLKPAPAAGGSGRDSIDELADDVLEIGGAPVDAWAVAATLESRGVRDLDAVERYGHSDVFALAERVFVRCRERARPPPPPTVMPSPWQLTSRRFAKHFSRGAFFFLPLMLQVIALAIFGYSQWAWVHFDNAQASTIALAVAASFLATAGSVQALGYLGPLFTEPGKDQLTERLAWSWMAVSTAAALLLGGLLVGANALTGAYPNNLLEVGITYYALVAILWLANGMLYMLHAYLAMVVATVVGLAAVIALREGAGLGIYTSQWIGLGVTSAVSLAWAGAVLRRRAGRTLGDLRLARFPPRRQLLRAAAPFFCFGFLYFALVLCDRFVGWSAGDHPLPFWFEVRYELGLDWALIAVVAGLAYLEHTVEAFSARLVPTQERFPGKATGRHNRDFLRFYRDQLIAAMALALAGVAIAALAAIALASLSGVGQLGDIEQYVNGAVTPEVFAWGAAGYVLLTWGLLNATFLFSLSRPWPLVAAIGAAVAVDLAVGLALSRTGPYWHSVIGLTAGCAVFAAVTTPIALRLLRRTDYYFFAAY